MTLIELEVIDRYLDAPYGSALAMEALADLIEMADDRRDLQWDKALHRG